MHALLALLVAGDRRRLELQRLLCAFPDPERVVAMPGWMPDRAAWQLAARQLHVLRACDVTIVPAWELPQRLRLVRPALCVLFVRGDVGLLSREAIGIVGARAASPRPSAFAREVAERLARRGTLVVSGGAHGIDAAAHAGALAGGGATLAYLGVAADRIYPRKNRQLFARILAHGGALCSELPPLTPSYKSGHALRNRLIAAHAAHLLIAEADLGSGSLGTAAFARACGTPIWVPPPALGGRRAGLEILRGNGWAQTLDDMEALARLAG